MKTFDLIVAIIGAILIFGKPVLVHPVFVLMYGFCAGWCIGHVLAHGIMERINKR